ncbi:MAG TPA: tyrosine-protein phosphatase [Blastocatellia bacterium]|nr:tyrosine-protein phosphatase [Blastocatellia bacterium]
MRRHIAMLKKMPHLHLEAAAVIGLLVILAFGLLKSPGTQAPNPANPEATGSGDSPAAAASGDSSTSNAPQITAPSAFPHITIKNFGQMDAHFYRGAQPGADDYKALAELGVKLIFDLRNDPTDYEKANAEAAGIKYVNIPMSDKQKPSSEQVETFMRLAKDAANWPFYVHCIGGRHRTGLIGAIYRYNNYGWDYDAVYREMKNYDYYSRWGHGAIKDFVKEYYDTMKAAKAAAIVAAPVTAPVSQPVATPAHETASAPVTSPPPPKPTE